MTDAFVDTPNAGSAADDLRAAAEGKTPEHKPSKTEQNALALKKAAAQKAAQFRDLAEDKANDLKSVASEKIEAMREGAGETAAHLRGAATDQWEDTREKARELHITMEDYVRENPTKAVLAAAGVGFVLGLLIRR